MASKMPPVPPANRSPKGTGADPSVSRDTTLKEHDKNFAQQGEEGNSKQNTTHQGYQQDR
jgi:hypothetical protein